MFYFTWSLTYVFVHMRMGNSCTNDYSADVLSNVERNSQNKPGLLINKLSRITFKRVSSGEQIALIYFFQRIKINKLKWWAARPQWSATIIAHIMRPFLQHHYTFFSLQDKMCLGRMGTVSRQILIHDCPLFLSLDLVVKILRFQHEGEGIPLEAYPWLSHGVAGLALSLLFNVIIYPLEVTSIVKILRVGIEVKRIGRVHPTRRRRRRRQRWRWLMWLIANEIEGVGIWAREGIHGGGRSFAHRSLGRGGGRGGIIARRINDLAGGRRHYCFRSTISRGISNT